MQSIKCWCARAGLILVLLPASGFDWALSDTSQVKLCTYTGPA